MGKFLREYWIWILIPFLVVTSVVLYALFGGSGAEDSVTPFSYPIY